MAQDPNKPKIIVDDDWKAQAQAEKEKLAREVEKPAGPATSVGAPGAAGTPAAAQAPGAAGGAQERELPPANFATLVSSMVTQVFFALGGIEDPQTGKRYLDLGLAKHHIDMLSVIEDKSKGNLSDEEKKLLDQALYETRMQYVQIASRVAQI